MILNAVPSSAKQFPLRPQLYKPQQPSEIFLHLVFPLPSPPTMSDQATAGRRKGGNGWKKTVLYSILEKDARHVCFSKHKRWLFSKASASTLSMLSSAQVGAVL